ncbi:ATP-binding cassette domain-containing protein [Vagococcus sp. PNs007]|uniref:ATP-binding cassette domain-containing protein n=1 Tax=Vagococcus proximus TaxID=2991417 RepID=A0ABT5X3I8_9ENTE|nr:ATP-binding cassette domain-containing protein [Vagococcus proximus]MDF0480484.1 ATP-binding cassette domain-containing protein [Vagococcus proximus]
MSYIELHQVAKTYVTKSGTVTALNSIELAIESGTIFGIVGYSGAGKSTLLRLLNGLEQATEGSVVIDKQLVSSLKGKDLREFRKGIGMIFQHFNLLWSRTLLENVALPLELIGVGKAERLEKARELLALVGLEGREEAYPSQLSGGQKQRVGIARALATEPKLLLCDEATSALDPQTTSETLALLADINKKMGVTIVLITHEMEVIRTICHKVAVMEQGKIVEMGDVINVFSRPKKEVTKRFVQQETVPDGGQQVDILKELAKNYPEGKIVKLTFTGERAQTPVISKLIRHTDVDVNIIQGQIQPTQTSSIGTLVLELLGNDDELLKAIDILNTQGIGVEVAEYE